MSRNYRKRTDQEWLALIQDCKASSLTISAWCLQHEVTQKALYYHTRKLRQRGYSIPGKANAVSRPGKQQEVFCLELTGDGDSGSMPLSSMAEETALRIDFHGVHIEVTNQAAKDTITNTFLALQGLC